MARLLSLALAPLLALPACYRPPAQGSARALAVWHDLERSAASAPEAAGAGDLAPIQGPIDPAVDAERALALALERSPAIAAGDAEVGVAEARVAAAKQVENPQLRLTNGRIDNLRDGDPTINTAVRVPVPRPGSRHARIKGAEEAAASTRAERETARRLLRAAIFELFARLAHLEADLKEAARLAEIEAQRRELTASRVERAVATRLDLALAEVAEGEAAAALAAVRERIAATEDELRRLTAGGPGLRFRVDPGELELGDHAFDRVGLIERALVSRAEVEGHRGRLGEASAQAYVARNAAWPWPTWAQIGYQISPGASTGALALGLAIDLPIFSWNRGQTRAAEALVRQRELEERAAVAAIVGEVDAAIARAVRTAERVLEIDRSRIEPLDRAAHEAAQALTAGVLDPLRVLEIELRRVEARRARLSALLDHRRAIIDLEAAVGAPLP